MKNFTNLQFLITSTLPYSDHLTWFNLLCIPSLGDLVLYKGPQSRGSVFGFLPLVPPTVKDAGFTDGKQKMYRGSKIHSRLSHINVQTGLMHRLNARIFWTLILKQTFLCSNSKLSRPPSRVKFHSIQRGADCNHGTASQPLKLCICKKPRQGPRRVLLGWRSPECISSTNKSYILSTSSS